ncbi:hypothetical protein ACFIJ5_03910 [Haloimpatiens sp. FM7330]
MKKYKIETYLVLIFSILGFAFWMFYKDYLIPNNIILKAVMDSKYNYEGTMNITKNKIEIKQFKNLDDLRIKGTFSKDVDRGQIILEDEKLNYLLVDSEKNTYSLKENEGTKKVIFPEENNKVDSNIYDLLYFSPGNKSIYWRTQYVSKKNGQYIYEKKFPIEYSSMGMNVYKKEDIKGEVRIKFFIKKDGILQKPYMTHMIVEEEIFKKSNLVYNNIIEYTLNKVK